MGSGRKLIRHTLMLGFASVISKVAVFLLMPLYTACLSPADFGTADILITTSALLIPFVSFAAPDAIFRFVAGGNKEGDALPVGYIFLGAGLILFFFILPLFSLSSVLGPYCAYLFFFVTASVIRSFAAHWLQARGEYALFAIQQLFCTLLTVSLEILFLPVLEMGVGGYWLATIIADSITACILLFYLSYRQQEKWRFNIVLARKMLFFALPLMPAVLFRWIGNSADRYFLLFFYGQSAIGLYAAAGRIPAILTFGVSLFMEAWRYAVLREEKAERGILFDRIYGLFLPLTVFSSSTIILTAPSLISRLYAPDYAAALNLVPLLTASAFFSGAAYFLGSIYTLHLRSSNMLLTSGIGAILNLVFNFILVPRFGNIGAGMATLASHGVLFFIRVWHCRRLLPFRPRIGNLCVSFFFLFLTDIIVKRGGVGWGILPCIASLLPFSQDIREAFWYFNKFFVAFFRKSRKKQG